LYSRVDRLERYSASVGLRLNEATTQASRMEVRAHDLELELNRANNERDVQRAAAEQKAKEAELQLAALCEKVEALTARAARSQQQEETLEALAITLTQKDALLEGQADALHSAETALKATREELDEGRKRTEGKC
jgi:chromosome segregation ATPase